MALSEQLISQFAKTIIANGTKQDTNKNQTLYGKTVKRNGQTYVQLDGSDLLTPVETTVSSNDGDRVTVKIENHTAIVTGNLSDPSASSVTVTEMGGHISEFEIIIAHKVTAEELAATNAYIENLIAISAKFEEMYAVTAEIEELQAKLATIDHLTATDIEAITAEIETLRAKFAEFDCLTVEDLTVVNAEIDNLKVYVGEFTYVSAEVLEAIQADVKKLDAEKLNAEQAEIHFANIDFANITELAVKKIFADYGVIEEIIISEGTVVKELVGVRIKGDLIEANTLKADSLVVKGDDGIYYRLNIACGAITDPEALTTEELEAFQNGLSGKVIVAKSIAAEKIAVDDLVAFGATIGGFNITNGAIYSGVKESISNASQGVHLSRDGQINIGDSSHYLKYYQTEDGSFKFDIAADNIMFTGNGGNIMELLNGIRINPSEGSISLGLLENPISLVIENDMIAFKKNGETFGWWDGSDFHTGNIMVEVNERAQFGNFAFVPRSDGSLMFLKVGDS